MNFATDSVTQATQQEDPAAVLLDQARKIVTGARRQAYGTPEKNFDCIAGLWEVYLNRRMQVLGIDREAMIRLDAADVSVMMILMKCARLAETPDHADSWRDCAGYSACGARASSADLSKGAP